MSLKDEIRVLVVDDMRTSRGLLIQALEDIGIKHIIDEDNGEDALQYMVNNEVHVVLCDYNMPKMDGLELLRSIRTCDLRSNTGFILVTGDKNKAVIDKGKVLKMNNFVLKPFDAPKIKKCLESVVGPL